MTEFRFPRPEDREAIIGLWEEAFGDSREFVEGFLCSGYAPDRCRVALENGKLLGMLFWFRCVRGTDRFAYIYAVATAASARGKGICTDLMEDTHRILAEQGYAGAVLCPGEPSLFRFYEKRGYSPLGTVTESLVKAQGSLSAEVADADSYGMKRTSLLPAGGVVQEEENIAFLAIFSQFLIGTSFAAAVSRDHRRVLEFVGDPACLPGLVAHLGQKEAPVRYPGEGRILTMVRMFHGKTLPCPFYFGLPFD